MTKEMAEALAGKNGDEAPEAPAIAVLTVTLKQDGSVNIMGPVQNKMLCYGMLEVAKQTIAALPISNIVAP